MKSYNKNVGKSKVKKLLQFLLFAGLLGFIWLYLVEPNMLVVTKYNIENKKLEGLKVVFASDLHMGKNDEGRLHRIVKKINAQKADIVLLGGDFVKGHKIESSMNVEKIADGLKNIEAKHGVYAVLGNHDWWQGGEKIEEQLRQNGIIVLKNENFKINLNGQSLYIAGLEDDTNRKPDVNKALEKATSPVLLLSHSPDVFPAIPKVVDLTLAGHTHGGQIVIPWYGAILTSSKFGKRYENGLISENGRRMVVTKGLGTSILPFRFNCFPEIVVIKF